MHSYYRRNVDENLRGLERELARTNDPATALLLYSARKRAGIPNAGALWYDWKCELESFIFNYNLADPLERVFLVNDILYCRDCGEAVAMDDYFTTNEDPLRPYPQGYDPSDPDHREAYYEMIRSIIINEYSARLYTLFLQHPGVATDDLVICAGLVRDLNRQSGDRRCDVVLKLSTHEVGWQEALAD